MAFCWKEFHVTNGVVVVGGGEGVYNSIGVHLSSSDSLKLRSHN